MSLQIIIPKLGEAATQLTKERTMQSNNSLVSLQALDNSSVGVLDKTFDDSLVSSLEDILNTSVSLLDLTSDKRSTDLLPEESEPLVESLDSNSLEILDANNEDSVFTLETLGTDSLKALGSANWDITHFDGVGNPAGEAWYWRQQQGSDSCAVVAQISIYESITGTYITEEDACSYAYNQGWFDYNEGTLLHNVGNILNALGISTSQSYNATLSDLIGALSNGDKPIVGLDASEIWQPMRDEWGTPIEQANLGHAVWVTGIDPEPDGSIKILLNDSGISSGQTSAVDFLDFYNAWQDLDFFVAVADTPY